MVSARRSKAELDLQWLRSLGSGFRRFFTNTVFDSTFMLLGIVIGSAFENPNIRVILTTMLASSLALGISTGVSVYEAESLEQNRRISDLEKALFRTLDGTVLAKSARRAVTLISILNFLTPLASCAIMISPFLLAALRIIEIRLAAWASILLAFGILFLAGAYLGNLGKGKPWIKGFRMLVFGIIAFVIAYLIESLI